MPSNLSTLRSVHSRHTAPQLLNCTVHANNNAFAKPENLCLHNGVRGLSSSAARAAIGGGFLKRSGAPKFGNEISEKEKAENARREKEAQLKKEEEERKAIEAQKRAEEQKRKNEEAQKLLAEQRQRVEQLMQSSSAPQQTSQDTAQNRHVSRTPLGWQCPNCSFFVSSRHSVCGKCGTPKETPPATAQVQANTSSHPESSETSTQTRSTPASPASRRTFFRPQFVSKSTGPQVESPSTPNLEETNSAKDASEAQLQPKVEDGNQTVNDATTDTASPDQPHMTRGKLFGSVRVERPPEPEVTKPERKQDDVALDELGLDPLEREIAALKVADPKYAQQLAEQQDWIREKRKRTGKRGQHVVDDDLEEAEPYLTHTERRRQRKIDREYEERKRQQEKKERELQKKQREEERKRAMREADEISLRSINLPEFISVGNLANALGMRPADFVKQLEDFGFEDVSYSHVLDAETAGLIAAEYGYETHTGAARDEIEDLKPAEEPTDTAHLPTRPPVITIMGHVDHGKTTLLDWLRKSSVVSTEHGGITQHIGAFSVTMPSGKVITFLDTPGHAAFLDMRRRGAEVTDIVILVVAANDSVKPQTVEAIKHAKEAGVPMIVALNKIDLPDVNPDQVKRDLASHGVWVEDIGGDVQCVHVSGRTGQGMVELEEAAVTLSEMLDHRADRSGNVEGWLIESTTKKGGKVATVLVTRGTLRPGKIIVAGKAWARVRSLRDESGQLVKKALPGTPVEVDGWREAPMAGDQVLQADTEQRAKEVIELRQLQDENKELSEDVSAINDARKAEMERRKIEEESDEATTAAAAMEQEDKSGPKGIPFLVKADVSGSVEAIVNSISSIGNSEVYAKVLRSGVGAITTSDIAHAAAAKADIISFNMPVDPGLKRQAQLDGVRILDYNVIYEVMDEVKVRLSEHLKPNIVQRVTGEAEVGEVFIVTIKAKGGGKGKMAIAGCKITNGVIGRGNKVKVMRGKDVVYTGKITSLKNLKKDVNEMRKGGECGIGFDGFTEFKAGDQVQTYEELSEKRTL